MARQKYVQYSPIAPLNILGRIDATITGVTAPVYSNQLTMAENANTDGYQVDMVALGLVPL